MTEHVVHYGVTGPRSGMTIAQRHVVYDIMKEMLPASSVQHNGMCVGADEDFCSFGREFDHMIIGHPGIDDEGHSPHRSWSTEICCDDVLAPRPFLRRNTAIVMASSLVIAAPEQDHEVLRSGTWSTIRRARIHGRRLLIVLPDGSVLD